MLDKYIDQHKKPVCFWFHIIGLIIFIYGLWANSWTLVIIALILFVLGHLFADFKKGEKSLTTPPSAPPSNIPSEPTPPPSV